MDGAPGQAEPAAVLPLDEVDRQAFAERLVAEAQSAGVRLIGPGGLLADVAKRVIETGLEVEMTEHLGYAKHAVDGRDGGNSRNGTRTKTVITELGPIEIDVPRDRDGTFEPATVRKRQRRLEGVDAMVLSLTAKGSTEPAGSVNQVRAVLGLSLRSTCSAVRQRQVVGRADRWPQ